MDILVKLCAPELHVRLWHVAELASGVSMPEAPVDEYHRFPARQYDVWTTGESAIATTKSKAVTMQQAPYNTLWFRIAAAYT